MTFLRSVQWQFVFVLAYQGERQKYAQDIGGGLRVNDAVQPEEFRQNDDERQKEDPLSGYVQHAALFPSSHREKGGGVRDMEAEEPEHDAVCPHRAACDVDDVLDSVRESRRDGHRKDRDRRSEEKTEYARPP